MERYVEVSRGRPTLTTWMSCDKTLQKYYIDVSRQTSPDRQSNGSSLPTITLSDGSLFITASKRPHNLNQTAEDYARFRSLMKLWHVERGATSSINELAMCPSYQRIIGMGETAVPLILRQMQQEGDEPDMWFWALQMLTGENPVTEEAQGDVAQMAIAWLNWGRVRYAW